MKPPVGKGVMNVEARLLTKKTADDIVRWSKIMEKPPARTKKAWDCSGATCIHTDLSGKVCGKSVPRHAAHGWLCTWHQKMKEEAVDTQEAPRD